MNLPTIIPTILTDSIQKTGRMSLLAAGKSAQSDDLFHQLGSFFHNQRGEKIIFVAPEFRKESESHFPGYMIKLQDLQLAQSRYLYTKQPVMILSQPRDLSDLIHLIDFVEAGGQGLLHLPTMTVMQALHRLLCFLPETNQEHWLWRLSEVMDLVLSQIHLVNSLEPISGESVYAREIILMTPLIKTLFRQKKINEIYENLLKSTENNPGLVSLNQSLLQLVFRRKIDVKTAFMYSQDPGDLDRLFKKVGI